MSIIFYNREKLKQHTRWRWGEDKLGNTALVVENWEQLAQVDATYVLLGIPEDIGVKANYGKPGTAKAWNACLDSLCNIQHTNHLQTSSLVILGEIDCVKEMQDAEQLEADDPFFPTKIGSLVKLIDNKVTEVIKRIITLNKVPIIIGGGHNNAYGNLKGASQAFNTPINCVNLDAHSDFRTLEHRHSGNGFRYAKEENYLHHYFILGLHRNYTSQSVYDDIEKNKETVKFSFFEDELFTTTNFDKTLLQAKKHISGTHFGVELDLDAIAGMGSSAISPSGYSLKQARNFVNYFSKQKNCVYVHLCEGSPAAELFPNQVGKSLAYLVSDIISI